MSRDREYARILIECNERMGLKKKEEEYEHIPFGEVPVEHLPQFLESARLQYVDAPAGQFQVVGTEMLFGPLRSVPDHQYVPVSGILILEPREPGR